MGDQGARRLRKLKNPNRNLPSGVTEDEVAEALLVCKGNASVAGRKLGVSAQTVRAFIRRSEACALAYQEGLESRKDIAEERLDGLVDRGELGAVTFYLKTQARDRGYVERADVNVNLGVLNGALDALRSAGYDPETVLKELAANATKLARQPAEEDVDAGLEFELTGLLTAGEDSGSEEVVHVIQDSDLQEV